MHRLAAALGAVLASAVVSSPFAAEPGVAHGARLSIKKAAAAPDERGGLPVLATLVQTHTDERLILDAEQPSPEQFSSLLIDRVTGERHDLDPRLVELLRKVAARHADSGAPRIELVSGFRSPKLNEMLRKKGHHVASRSQHSLGHAVDFRVVLPGEERGIDPRVLEREIRELGWDGGVGVYTQKSDWFVHADVGPTRRWDN